MFEKGDNINAYKLKSKNYDINRLIVRVFFIFGIGYLLACKYFKLNSYNRE